MAVIVDFSSLAASSTLFSLLFFSPTSLSPLFSCLQLQQHLFADNVYPLCYVARVLFRSGESSTVSPRCERLPVNCLPSTRRTQSGSSKAMHSSGVSSDTASWRKTR